MPCLNGKYNPQTGPVINIRLVPGGTITAQNPKVPTSALGFSALLDTGASGTCISLTVAQSIGVSAIGMFPMVSATHEVPVNVYLVDIVIPLIGSSFFIGGISAFEFSPPAGSPFQAIIGRDIISRGVLTLSSDGHFAFCL
jgi:hypothetical protein